MKKILSLLLVLVLVFSVVACKSSNGGTDGIQTVIAKTKEGAVANAFGINQADIKKSEGSAELKLQLKEGFINAIPNLPFEDKKGLEKLLITVVGKMGAKMMTTSNVDKNFEISTGMKINYDGKELLTTNIKFNEDKYYYYIPELLDKTFVISLTDIANSNQANSDIDPKEQMKTIRAMKAIMEIKNNDKEVDKALKAFLKEFSGASEEVFTKRTMISDPEDAEVELISGKIKTKKYGVQVKLSDLPDVFYELIVALRAKPEAKDSLIKLIDATKVALEKDDKFKDFYENEKDATKEKFEKDIKEIKTGIEVLFTDEKLLEDLKKEMAEAKAQLQQVDAMANIKLDVHLDDKQILRAQELVVDTPFLVANLMFKLEAVNEGVKASDIAMGKEEIKFDANKPDALNQYKPEVKENMKKMLDGEAYKALYNDLKEGSKSFKGNDKMIVDQLLEYMNPEKLKPMIDSL